MLAHRQLLLLPILLLCLLSSLPARAEEEALLPSEQAAVLASSTEPQPARADDPTIELAMGLLGIRYRLGGSKPESGFDCSGFVRYVFLKGLGIELPHSAREQSRSGEPIAKDELQPGDLVFFNTMRHAFSHVGIYLGENLFVHAPRRGSRVRIEDMSGRYWTKRFNGARRLALNTAVGTIQ